MGTEIEAFERETLFFTIETPQGGERDNVDDIVKYMVEATNSSPDITPKCEEDITDWINNGTVRIARSEEGEIIGCVGYYQIQNFPGLFQMVSLYVKDEFRGREHPETGKTVGKQLFETILEAVAQVANNPTLIVQTTTPKLQQWCEELAYCHNLPDYAFWKGRVWFAHIRDTIRIASTKDGKKSLGKGMGKTTGKYKAYYLTPATRIDEI